MSDERERPGRAEFRTTQWSLVIAAADTTHPESRRALESLCATYWYPLYAYVRRRGSEPGAAQDITQGFLAHLLEKKSLRVADPERGRFRNFLLTALQSYLIHEWERGRALRRGGDKEVLALDLESAEARYVKEPSDDRTPDRLFLRRWALSVLERTMDRLREEEGRSETPERSERLVRLLTGEDAGAPYRKVAAELEMSETAVKVAVHRLRKRYGQLLRDEVAQTVDDPARVDEEIHSLFVAIEP